MVMRGNRIGKEFAQFLGYIEKHNIYNDLMS
jgi:hypothetical protein